MACAAWVDGRVRIRGCVGALRVWRAAAAVLAPAAALGDGRGDPLACDPVLGHLLGVVPKVLAVLVHARHMLREACRALYVTPVHLGWHRARAAKGERWLGALLAVWLLAHRAGASALVGALLINSGMLKPGRSNTG